MRFDPQANYVPDVAIESDLPGDYGFERGGSGFMRFVGRMFALGVVAVMGVAGWWFWSNNTAVGESATDSLFELAGPQLAAWRTDERVTRAYQTGMSLSRTGRHRDAIPYFEEAVMLAPAYAEAHYQLGLAYARCGDPASANAEVRRLQHMDPGMAVELAAHIP